MSKIQQKPSSGGVTDVWSLVQKEYRVGDVLNTGRDGTVVRKGTHKTSGDLVALKSIPVTGKSKRDAVRREAQLMQCLDHPNVLQCYGVFEGAYEMVIVLEFCGGGDLLDYVNGRGPSTEEDARRVFLQILEALIESHAFGIAHRDIKLENILLRSDGSVLLGDYGLAKTYSVGEKFTSPCGTLTYAGPELHQPLNTMRVDPEAADVFALGVVLYALLIARLPFEGATDEEVIANICAGNFKLPELRLSPAVCNLIRGMLASDAKKRLSLSQVLDHEWTSPNKEAGSPVVRTRSVSAPASPKPNTTSDKLASQVNSTAVVATSEKPSSSSNASSPRSSTPGGTSSPKKPSSRKTFAHFCKSLKDTLFTSVAKEHESAHA